MAELAPLPAVGAKSEIRPLTALRGIAALAVVLFHFKERFKDNFCIDCYSLVVERGYLWVDFFFVLSGFVLCHVYVAEFGTAKGSYRSFLIKRVARIYPLHFVVLVLFLLPIFWPDDPTLPPRTAIGFVKNLTLVHAWSLGFSAEPLTWNYPSWSISAEWAAYILFPAILSVCYRAPLAVSAALTILSLAGLDWLESVLVPEQAHSFRPLSTNLGWLRCVIEFSTGVVLYRVFRRNPATLRSDLAFVAMAMALLLAMHWGLRDLLIVTLMCGLLCTAALNDGKASWLLSLKPLVYLGTISYSIYMTQALVDVGILNRPWFQEALADTSAPISFVVYVVACFSVAGIAAASYRFVEKPGRQLLRNAADRFAITS